MALSREARQLIDLLDEAGFGYLAGEIFAEISLGRLIDKGADIDQNGTRRQIADEDHITEVIRLLRLRLIEPVRALAEAERIAGNILNNKPIRIRFVDDDGNEIQKSANPTSPGDSGIADKLEELLRRLPQMIEPELPTRT